MAQPAPIWNQVFHQNLDCEGEKKNKSKTMAGISFKKNTPINNEKLI